MSMRRAFSYYLWQKRHQSPGDSDDEVLRIASLQSTLLNIRSLDEFFRKQTWPSDIRAAQYLGFNNPGPFLMPAEKKRLDQLVVHLTFRRVDEFDHSWKVFEFVNRGYSAFSKFLDYIKAELFADQTHVQASIVDMKRRCETWLKRWRMDSGDAKPSR
jgi:hypothetical protein